MVKKTWSYLRGKPQEAGVKDSKNLLYDFQRNRIIAMGVAEKTYLENL